MNLAREALIGAWTLRSWQIDYSDGRGIRHPFGTDAIGQLLYGADGHMSAVISRARRASLGAASTRAAGLEACRDAFTSFFCYAGRWRLEGSEVVHVADLALNPDMAGTEQRRTAHLEGDTLELSAVETDGDGRTRTHRLIWRRATGAGRDD